MYLGRLVGVGRLGPYDKAFAVYAVSGRSDPSKERKAKIKYRQSGVMIDSSRRKRVPLLLKPFDLLTDGFLSLPREQWKKRKLILYDAMRSDSKNGLLVVSNGRQTDPIYDWLIPDDPDDFHLAIDAGLVDCGGAEPDDYRTPRIAGVISSNGKAALGIVTENGMISEKVNLTQKTKYVSTYKGDPDNQEKIVISDLILPTGEINLAGKSAQDLADNLYDWMDRDLVVCTAAALWNPTISEWELAVRNLHE